MDQQKKTEEARMKFYAVSLLLHRIKNKDIPEELDILNVNWKFQNKYRDVSDTNIRRYRDDSWIPKQRLVVRTDRKKECWTISEAVVLRSLEKAFRLDI